MYDCLSGLIDEKMREIVDVMKEWKEMSAKMGKKWTNL